MFQVGEVDSKGKQLITVTELCLKSAIEICKPNEHFYNIGNNTYIIKIWIYLYVIFGTVKSFYFFLGNVIEKTANEHNLNVIPAILGHGIGTYFHGAPDICHFGTNKNISLTLMHVNI